MGVLGALAVGTDIANAASNLFNTGYNVYQDQRNFKYQKELQQELFKRDDTAIQRRVQDAIAAGINPNAVVGSGAGVTSAGGASSTPVSKAEFNFGSYLDMKTKQEILEQQYEATNQARYASDIMRSQATSATIDAYMQELSAKYMLGVDQVSYTPARKGRPGGLFMGYNNFLHPDMNMNDAIRESPFMKQLQWNTDNQRNAADMLSKQNYWFTANQILDMINSGTGSIGNVAGAFGSGFGSYQSYQRGKFSRQAREFYSNSGSKPRIGFYE